MVNDELAMSLIAASGEARSYAFEAVKFAREGNFTLAEELLQKSSESAMIANKAQAELLNSELRGEEGKVTWLRVHAQDHLMTSLLAQDLIREIIYLHKANASK